MNEVKSFEELEISEKIKRAISEMGIDNMTPIQKKAILPALKGADILAQAPTGTGKTFAFGIPLLENTDRENDEIQGIVLCPTRELALQTAAELRGLLKYEEGIRVLPIYGGENIERQITALRAKPQIIVATPGRFNDHVKRKKIKTACVKTVVLDEADEMLSMGFLPDIEIILRGIPDEAQKLMFSATVPDDVLGIAKRFQNPSAQRITVTSAKQETSPQIKQYYMEMKHSMKTEVLKALLDIKKFNLCLVFCNTKKMVDELYEDLSESGFGVAALHGDMKQQERDRVMYKFRNDKINVLIATDVAARGVDVENIDAVINYDVPLNEEYYVHRIGRTGRADKSGIAYTFLSNREMFRLKEIMNYTKSNILPMKRPSLDEAELAKAGVLLEKAEKIIKTEDLSRYRELAEKYLSDGGDAASLAAALLYINLEPKKTKKAKTAENGMQNSPKKTKKFDVKGGTARLFFNVGSLDKIRRRHLEELVNDHPALCGMRIKGVDIYDKFSFMDVDAKDAKDICDALTGMKFKGRELLVEIADPKENNSVFSKTKKRKKTR